MSILDTDEIIIIVASILATILIIIMIKLCCRNKSTYNELSDSFKNINIINNEKARLI